MRHRRTWVPALAAPAAVFGHIVSESLVSGQNVLAVALHPAHAIVLALALAAMPLWFRAAGTRTLGQAIWLFIALTLLLEGNGLGATAMAGAFAISALIAWLGGLAITHAIAEPERGVSVPVRVYQLANAPDVDLSGPYYAFLPTRGNRPPPRLLLAGPR